MAENGVRFVAGQWNAICDVCGQKYKSGDMKKRWDGLMVCHNDWEPRHPQDFLRAVPDRQAVPWSRPRTEDIFVGPACPYPTSGGLADFGTADCAKADYNIPLTGEAMSTTIGAGPFIPPFPLTVPEGDSQIDNNMTNNYDLNG